MITRGSVGLLMRESSLFRASFFLWLGLSFQPPPLNESFRCDGSQARELSDPARPRSNRSSELVIPDAGGEAAHGVFLESASAVLVRDRGAGVLDELVFPFER